MAANKNKNTTFEQRQIVIFNHTKGISIRQIGKTLNIPKSTVGDIIKRYQREDRIDSIKQKGQPEKLSVRDKRFLVRTVQSNPKISAPKLATMLYTRNKQSICAKTVRKVLKDSGYNSRVARNKPYINKINCAKRLDFAKNYVHAGEMFWNDVIFVDESKFNLFGCDSKQKV